MVDNRSLGRTVHFYNALSPDDALGGLILNQSITEKNFLFMLEILIVASDPYSVSLRGSGEVLTQSDAPLKPGQYDIRSNAPEEASITRVYSGAGSGRTEKFRNQVRERDRKGLWFGFEAAHVFPLADGQLFGDSGLSRWITNREGEHGSGINSCQNGFLMQSNIHQEFDSFSFSINPDDNYKVISFDDPFRIDGRVLDPNCRATNNEGGVRDELLRWHFRQAVLGNMRGADMQWAGSSKKDGGGAVLKLDGLSWQKGLSH
ncbi:hypothetical protein V1506DRAFT_555613 [Lipomyces tetrasporus]